MAIDTTTWVKVIPKKTTHALSYASNVIRYSITNQNEPGEKSRYGLLLLIGSDIANKIGIGYRDNVEIYISSVYPRKIFIRKALLDGEGYKIQRIGSDKKAEPASYRIYMSWRKFKPTQLDQELNIAAYEINQLHNGIEITLEPELLNNKPQYTKL